MDLNDLYRKINLQPEIINKIECFLKTYDISQIDNQLNGFLKEESAYFTYEKLNEFFKDEKDNTAILTCYLLTCLKVYEEYKKEGISEDIFIDTMKCFTRFIDECKEKTGRYDFDRPWWTHKQVSQVIYRIGELEYEFLEKEKLISIHIPSDAVLSKENLKESFSKLFNFVKQHKVEYTKSKVICDTWLLSLTLKELLPEQSKIRNFMDCFDIVCFNENNDSCFEWVFKCKHHKDFEQLPENTSLQKKVKQLMIQGKHIGSATGYLKEQYYE